MECVVTFCEKVVEIHNFGLFWPWFWKLCATVWGEAVHHSRKHMGTKAAHFMAAGKQGKEGSWIPIFYH